MTAGAIIEHFSGFSTRVLLGSENLNSPRNAMLFAPLVHKRFDRLDIWLTPFEASGCILNLCTWAYRCSTTGSRGNNPRQVQDQLRSWYLALPRFCDF